MLQSLVMEDLKSKTLKELKQLAGKFAFPPFKAKEIFRFIHALLKENINELTVLSLEERRKLAADFYISKVIPHKVLKGKSVQKVAFKLEDGLVVETVLMEYEKGRKTLCISSQAGCPVGCLFCATGGMGFKRNLTAGEILSQVYYFARDKRISNIVFMGMGEPFLNYNNVIKAAKILNHPLGRNIAARKIVFSTIGIISGIKKLTRKAEQFRLAWSLVSPFDVLRDDLVPLPELEPVSQVVKALKEYQKKTKRRVTIEYVVLGGVNDKEEDVRALIKIAKKLDSHINLISYNPQPSPLPFFGSEKIKQIFGELQKAKVPVTIRKSLGRDISAACGQLARS